MGTGTSKPLAYPERGKDPSEGGLPSQVCQLFQVGRGDFLTETLIDKVVITIKKPPLPGCRENSIFPSGMKAME
jgi:hypothetical protein